MTDDKTQRHCPSCGKDKARVAEVIADGDGWWSSCSGCHETNEGSETGDYPFSKTFKCYIGAGCGDCGGIGIIWNFAMTDADAREALKTEVSQ